MNKSRLTPVERQALLERLRSHYRYEPATGLVQNVRTGRVVTPYKSGARDYPVMAAYFRGKRVMLSYHLVVWALCRGRWPAETIDHLDGNPMNNRIGNLRECSPRENLLNKVLPWRPNAVTGLPGVQMRKGRYVTSIGRHNYYFPSPDEAFCMGTLCGKVYEPTNEKML